jgi:hypothetical protein
VFYDVGPGKVCQGLMKRIAPEAATTAVTCLADIDALPE